MSGGFPYKSADELTDGFVAGLERQLEDGGLGAFILVLANASFEPGLWDRFQPALHAAFDEHADEICKYLRAGRALTEPPDDQLVFLKLMAMGFRSLGPTRFDDRDGWEIQYNPLRGLRPPRAAGRAVEGIELPFDAQRFNFLLPALETELFWKGELLGMPLRFFYNKFPFVHHHFLAVPDAYARHPQVLNNNMLSYAWRLTGELAETLPGIVLSYNSYGAHASVNHLHFQCVERAHPLPLEQPKWRHNGGETDYPAPCIVIEREEDAWPLVRLLHKDSHPYNLVMRPGRLYVLPRRMQGTYSVEERGTGHAWYEMAGGVVLTQSEAFDSLSGTDIADTLSVVGGDLPSSLTRRLTMGTSGGVVG